ncbi:DUF599 family protein [Asticcacaulis sp. EMRT-3]|uniref:DUF599 domain-containing protein n=1 Tax=Asticcacaulis sp. EMRT-3 TaxID=3040349 RepID=UPI0024AE9CC3|nr:DUF599 family protein [Asticcacaulis sp. EMRT-3]MDI7773732.1 DUF599 family protein [Asticcacaulis sp. EMRT-3]
MSVLLPSILHLLHSPLDLLALTFFILCWFGYEPFLRAASRKAGVIARDLSVVRHAWMREMVIRSFKLFDSNLIAHGVNSATNFSSANLILIAAVAGVLFGGQVPIQSAQALGIDISSPHLLQFKLALVLACLTRGLLNFIWSIRQINYCAAGIGSLPDNMDAETASQFGDAMFDILEPAMSNFSQGVRGYYFSLAAGAWLFGPEALIVATGGAVALLVWRQSFSRASHGMRRLRELLDAHPYPTPTRPIQPAHADSNSQNGAAQTERGDF